MVLPPPSNKIIVHVDMNSFFASVEQQYEPKWRGKPLVVCPYAPRFGSSIIAASVEAKRFGVKVGMRVGDAQKKAPGLIAVTCDPAKYREASAKAMKVFRRFTDRVEVYSIDEAFLDLTGWGRDFAEVAWQMACLRRRIRQEVGEWMGCSIGIAPTRFLAKTASDLQKPNGLALITPENLDAVLAELDLEDVCGIAKHMRRRFARLGLFRLLDIKRAPPQTLLRTFGKEGFFWWCRLHGLEFEQIRPMESILPKTIGHSHVLSSRIRDARQVDAVLVKLVDRAGRRLRKLQLCAGGMWILVTLDSTSSPQADFGWRGWGGESRSRYHVFSEPVSDAFTLVTTMLQELRQIWVDERIAFVAVTLVDLVPMSAQQAVTEIATWGLRMDRLQRASVAMDRIRERHGFASIGFAPVWKLLDEDAPDRIGFRKVDGVAGVDVAMLSGTGYTPTK